MTRQASKWIIGQKQASKSPGGGTYYKILNPRTRKGNLEEGTN